MPKPPVQIYIVDDEPSICTAYTRLLRSARMRSQAFCSVEDFLQADCSSEHACVICDVQMPGAGGLELPAFLAQIGRQMPVIIVTAQDTSDTRELAQQVGAAAYFRKPVDDQALLDAIEWALAGSAAREKEKPVSNT
jgi:FixJ family two-component response regulator